MARDRRYDQARRQTAQEPRLIAPLHGCAKKPCIYDAVRLPELKNTSTASMLYVFGL